MLNLKTYFIKEHVGLLKFGNTYDIYDANTQAQVGVSVERPALWAILGRLVVNKTMLPTELFVYQGTNPDDASALQFSLHKGFAVFRPKVEIRNAQKELVGYLQRTKLISLSSYFDVFDANGQQVAALKGDWKGWNFTFVDPQGQEFGAITKKWAGIAKEFFTSADQYVVDLGENANPTLAMLLLAAGLAVDTVYKEK